MEEAEDHELLPDNQGGLSKKESLVAIQAHASSSMNFAVHLLRKFFLPGELKGKNVSGMCASYKQFPEFDIHKDPETIYAHFVKYAEQFKNNHLKAYNITDKAQQLSLFLESIGEANLDTYKQLSHTETDLDGAVNALQDKFKESQNW